MDPDGLNKDQDWYKNSLNLVRKALPKIWAEYQRIFSELDSVESLDLLAENESLKKQNEELHQLLANQQSDYAQLSNQLSNQNEKLVDAKEATETQFETLFNNLQKRKVLSEIANKT